LTRNTGEKIFSYEEPDTWSASAMEKRSAPRTQTYLRARAVCRPDDFPVECLVVDLSPTGARLQFSDGGPNTLPDRFELLIVKTGERPIVQVAWRTAHEVGVRFETATEAG